MSLKLGSLLITISKLIRIILCVSILLVLSSCGFTWDKIDSNTEVRIIEAYYQEFIEPINPEVKITDVHFDLFLRRWIDGKHQVYLFAWEIKEDTDEWSLSINEQTYTFDHEIEFIVFRSSNKKFYSVSEAIELSLFTIDNFEYALTTKDVSFRKNN